MVTRSQIEKLNTRVDDVAAKLDPDAPPTIAIIKRGERESRVEAIERHLAERPQDRNSRLAVLLDKSPHRRDEPDATAALQRKQTLVLHR